MIRIFRALGLLLCLLFLIHILNNKVFSLPPIGKLLNPFHGYASSDSMDDGEINLEILTDSAKVIWDKNNIPHIFAENQSDLYILQGYVVAQDRLWQMDFVSRVHEGRLSEIIGDNPDVLTNDIFMRTIGIVEGAKASLESIAYCQDRNSKIYKEWDGLESCPDGYKLIINEEDVYNMLVSYSKGVNAYIENLHWTEYPIEYKILDYTPELWTPFKTCILLKSMTLTLSGRNADIVYEIVKNIYQDKVKVLYPESPYFIDPIVPLEDLKNIENEIENQICSDEELSQNKSDRDALYGLLSHFSGMYNPGIGSNNWAVDKNHTENGNAILANDPHLGLSLPNVWYVMQLSTPNLDVMGATFPGAPGILSGFNNYIAWGETNAEGDVSDFYKIDIDSDNSNHYWYDGVSIPFELREEKILIRGHAFQFPKDTTIVIKSTKHGPIIVNPQNNRLKRYSRGSGGIESRPNYAFRWTAHDPSNEIKAFYNLNYATNYETFIEALSDFDCPSQNFVYADVEGNVGMYHRGKLPIKCQKGVLPGNDSQYLWAHDDISKFIPDDHLPRVKNPKRGYVSSANQYPVPSHVDSAYYPYFLPGKYWPAHRGSRINNRINELIDKNEKINMNHMADIQNDSYNKFAEILLPQLLESIKDEVSQNSNKNLSEIYNYLLEWDFHHQAERFEPLIFDYWYENLNEAVWGDLFIDEPTLRGLDNTNLYPSYDVLAYLIETDKNSEWFDDYRTDSIIESFDDLAWKTFIQTIDFLRSHSKLKDKSFSNWKYSDLKAVNIHHIISSSNFDAFSRMDIPVSGSQWSPNAMKVKFGPSWRYIVEMKQDSVHAIGIYPGGQSGDPGSKYYDDYIDKWQNGEYLDLHFTYYKDKNNLKGKTVIFKNE